MRFSKKIFAALLSFAIFCGVSRAELFSSSLYGWTLDLPEGFFLSDATDDGLSYFFEHDFMKVRLAIKIFPSGKFQRNDLAMEDTLNKLNADGEIDGFLWRERQVSVANYSFQIPGNKTAQSGWGISASLPKSGADIVVLCYADDENSNDVLQFIISALDSLVIEEDDWRKPGLITSYAFPAGQKKDIALQIDGKKIFTKIPDAASDSASFVIEREFSVLTLYASRKNWKEAWQRYYRLIFREAYSRLDEAAKDIHNALSERPLSAQNNQQKFEMLKKLLAWVQDFQYARNQNASDFNDLASAMQDKGSDCDSRALLLCVLMEHYGVKTELFVSMEYSHAICGFDLAGAGARINVDGTNYLLCETTAHVEPGLVAQEHSETSKWISVDLP